MKTDTTFYKKYTPQYNEVLMAPLREQEDTGSTLPEDLCSFGGCMYETYGEELEHVIQAAKDMPEHVWTILEVDGKMYISAGFHLVNRWGYLITDNNWKSDTEEYKVREQSRLNLNN